MQMHNSLNAALKTFARANCCKGPMSVQNAMRPGQVMGYTAWRYTPESPRTKDLSHARGNATTLHSAY